MAQKFFPEYGNQYTFASFEEKVLEYWKTNKIFDRTLEKTKSTGKVFGFYDGPPFATGLPHYGHLLAGTIKDIVPRYWTKRGYYVPRRFGWDTHGLPVEFEMEKTLGLSGSLAIQDYGVAKFNEACRGIVLRYTGEWRKTVERMGRWIDMDNDYKTMDPEFMESIWWVFKQLWDKKLVYQGKKVVPYSWRLTAPLSNFEASQNYKDVQDPAITVLLPITDGPLASNTALAIWTTTPWTLPANLAIAAHPDSSKVEYGIYKLPSQQLPVQTNKSNSNPKIEMGSFGYGPERHITQVIVANSLAEKLGLTEHVSNIENSKLFGLHYHPLFECFSSVQELKNHDRFKVIPGDFVSSTDGTGLVHMAPAFGEDDFFACQKAGIELVDPTDMEARYTKVVEKDARLKDLVGKGVKDEDRAVDKGVIKALKDAGLLFKQETLQHSYPFCERSDTPLIYKAISSWFVKIDDDMRAKMVANNQQIKWVPEHIKDGRFGKWLENARDWCISRNRFWGTPIPVWICKSCEHQQVVGSRADLEKLAGKAMPDLHKHFVDEVVTDCPKCNAKAAFKRTTEVLDCWFESGSMPYAQGHYPFENKDAVEKNFPADFIAEGLDQTRGWFYTLTVLSTALFNKPAFKNCIVNGMVLAEDGKKMSKRLKNYPDPSELIGKHGADALRLYLMQSPAMHAQDLRFSERGLIELMRAVMIPLWNSYGFFASYANIDQWTPEKISSALPVEKRPMLDQWILARSRQTTLEVHSAMENFHLNEVAPKLISLIEDLTNWYIRLSRDRFWGANEGPALADKNAAYATLWTVLSNLSESLAAGMPFWAEVMHAALHGRSVDALGNVKSVHEDFYSDETRKPLTDAESKVLAQMDIGQKIILLGRSLRGEAKIGLRQPLSQIRIAGVSERDQNNLLNLKDFILGELNIKALEIVGKASDLVEESAKPNFRTVGKKAGARMKEVQTEIAKWTSSEISKFETSGTAIVLGFELAIEDIEIVRKAKPGKLALAQFGVVGELDTALTPELIREGLQREIINRIQQRRKEMQFNLADRIAVQWSATGLIAEILNEKTAQDFIGAEILCTKWEKAELSTASEDFAEHGKIAFDLKVV